MKKLAALFILLTVMCWAASAMALTAVAPDTLVKGMTSWDAIEPQADFMHYKVRFDGKGGTATSEAGNFQLVITYSASGRPQGISLRAANLNDKKDKIEVAYDAAGNMAEAVYWTDLSGGSWRTSYRWQFDQQAWQSAGGETVAGLPAFDAAAYALKVIYAGEELPEPTEKPYRVTLDNPYGKLAVMLGDMLLDYTGFEKFEGADFYFEHGLLRDDMDGLTLIDGTWYNMQQGRFNTADGMVFFEGATFLVKGGVLDETQSGLIEYNGQKFVFSYGQFVSSLYGAWPDPISGRFVYVWAGQFYPITDLVSYDGQVFYFINGYLATDFVGTVYDFNGTPFNIIYGQAY